MVFLLRCHKSILFHRISFIVYEGYREKRTARKVPLPNGKKNIKRMMALFLCYCQHAIAYTFGEINSYDQRIAILDIGSVLIERLTVGGYSEHIA